MDEEEFVSWYQVLAENPDYYTNTEQGQKELADMIRKESERLLEELGRTTKRTKEIIWLSRFCPECQYFSREASRMRCSKWAVRIVKPFHGRPIWGHAPSRTTVGEKELVVEGIDWNVRWREISDKIIETAVGMVNGGYPYYCYKGK